MRIFEMTLRKPIKRSGEALHQSRLEQSASRGKGALPEGLGISAAGGYNIILRGGAGRAGEN